MRLILVAVMALASTVHAQDGSRVKLNGYAEYRQDHYLIVEGQRVFADAKTKFKGDGIRSLNHIPLGYEVKVEGRRQKDGTVRATKIEAKRNGNQMYESEVLRATNQLEQQWVRAGEMFFQDGRRRYTVGPILESGPAVERVREIMDRLRPPYVDASDVRVHVVDTKEWNASAMGNGSIWVYTGLLNDLSDDEIAIILGHELAHYTHEHSRRGMKQGMWGQLAGVASAAGLGRSAAGLGANLGLSAWQSGYSRDLEDQSDRVGLRYAYEAGYDITKGPDLWKKFRAKYGESDSMQNFLFGSHSRPSDRIRNLMRELRLTYPETIE